MMRPPKWWALFLCPGRSAHPLGGRKSLHLFRVGNGPGLRVNFRISFDPNYPNQKSSEIFTENTPSKCLVFLRITKGLSSSHYGGKNFSSKHPIKTPRFSPYYEGGNRWCVVAAKIFFQNTPLKTGLKSGYSEEG